MKINELKNRYVYNPECDYYFLSVSYVGTCPAWIRRPFQTEGEIREFLFEYFCNPKDYRNIEIYPEDLLRDQVFLEPNDANSKTSLRNYRFGNTYKSESEYYEKSIQPGSPMKWKSGYQEWLSSNEVN